MNYRLAPQATADISAICANISRDNSRASEKFAVRLKQKFEALARNPNIGRARPELRAEWRSFPFGNYLIPYRAIPDGAEIVRVIHGARDLDDLL